MSDTAVAAPVLEEDAVVEAKAGTEANAELVEEDLLVEDVSIDGMCGVY